MESDGPLTVAQYMAAALGHPQWGYYMQRDPLGRDGDFITAPEISQVFGELLGLWCLDYWRRMGSPDPFLLVEAGPGRGTLMADALRAVSSLDPAFPAAARVHLVETSPALREHQEKALSDYQVTWVDSLEGIGDKAPILLLANEFLDALPVRQFQRAGDGWRERLVGLDSEKSGEKSGGSGGFCFCLAEEAAPLPDALNSSEVTQAPTGAIIETCPDALAFVGQLSARLGRDGGAALIVDYGHTRSAVGDTLQAVRGHRPCSVLAEPGAADITAHVDFAALASAARESGAYVHGPRTQGAFLRDLGIEARSARLAEAVPEEQRRLLESGCQRLISEDEMGALFKVLAITGAPQPVPAGYSNRSKLFPLLSHGYKKVVMTADISIPLISSGALNDLSGVRHAFFTRQGGVSAGIYESLNCGPGSDDDPECVRVNRERAMTRLGMPGNALVTPYQTHSATVAVVDGSTREAEMPQEMLQADALVSGTPGVVLGILTADCAPVLLADDQAGVVAIAHVGWKGALAGVIEATVESMTRLGAVCGSITAVIGPCISMRSYEVGPEFPDNFPDQSTGHYEIFSPAPRQGHFLFDFSAYIFRRLHALELKSASRLPYDTCTEVDRFFSYRRSQLTGESDFGRNLSVIFLEK